MKNMSKWKKYTNIGIVLLILIASLYSLFFCNLKNSWFVDEVYSYGLANSSYLPFLPTTDSWVDASYYKDYVSVQNNPFNFGSVLYNQSVDVHPPAYYMILHFISSIFIGCTSKWVGLSINIVASVLGGVFIYEIILLLIDNHSDKQNQAIAMIVMLFYLISNGYLSNLLYIRMYCLASFFAILLLYLHFRLINHDYMDSFATVGIPCTLFLGSLTHYFFIIYAFPVCFVFFLNLIYQKKYLRVVKYTGSSVFSMTLAYISFPHVFEQMKRNGGNQGLVHLANLSDIKAFLTIIINYECNSSGLIYIISLFLLIIVFAFSVRNEIKKCKFNIAKLFFGHLYFELIFIPPIFYFLLLVKYVGETRYYSLIYPALFLLVYFPFIKTIRKINGESVRKLTVWAFCCLLPVCIINISLENFRYTHFTALQQSRLDGLNCVFLNDGWAKYTANVFEFINYDHIYISSTDNVDWMETDEKVENSQNLIVYIDDDYNAKNTIDNILEKGKYHESELIFDDHGYAKCYLFSR